MTAVFAGVQWLEGLFGTVVAALIGPALLRSQLALLGSAEADPTIVGPAGAYTQFRREIDKNITDIYVNRESAWITNDVLPALESIALERIRTRIGDYLTVLSRYSAEKQADELAVIDRYIADDRTDEERKRAIVQRLLDIGARRLVKSLLRESRPSWFQELRERMLPGRQ